MPGAPSRVLIALGQRTASPQRRCFCFDPTTPLILSICVWPTNCCSSGCLRAGLVHFSVSFFLYLADTKQVVCVQMVAEAVAAVVRPEATEVTDADVLSSMIEAAPELKDLIVTNLAIQQIGPASWIHDSRFAAELNPPSAAA